MKMNIYVCAFEKKCYVYDDNCYIYLRYDNIIK